MLAHPRFWEETADRLPIPEAETRDPFPFIALATHRGPRFNNNNWWLQGLAISFKIYDCASNIKVLVAQGPAVLNPGGKFTIGHGRKEQRQQFSVIDLVPEAKVYDSLSNVTKPDNWNVSRANLWARVMMTDRRSRKMAVLLNNCELSRVEISYPE
jgi:hypothetical protein